MNLILEYWDTWLMILAVGGIAWLVIQLSGLAIWILILIGINKILDFLAELLYR